MKSAKALRILLVLTAVLISSLTCYGQDGSSDLLVGKWNKQFQERTVTFTFISDSKYQVEFAGDDEIDVWGSYKISGNQITFTDEGGEYSSDETGVYEFKLAESALTFTQVDDPVYGRSILVEGNWSKAK